VQRTSAVIVDNNDLAARTFTDDQLGVDHFQKNGFVLVGSGLTVNVDHNTVTGAARSRATAAERHPGERRGDRLGHQQHCQRHRLRRYANAVATGILVFGAGPGVVVSGNTVTGAAGDGDYGIAFVNSDAAAAHGTLCRTLPSVSIPKAPSRRRSTTPPAG